MTPSRSLILKQLNMVEEFVKSQQQLFTQCIQKYTYIQKQFLRFMSDSLFVTINLRNSSPVLIGLSLADSFSYRE